MQIFLQLTLAFLLSTTSGAADDVTPHAGMLRYPDVSQSHIVFSYANDLWIVSREGGTALPLSSPSGVEMFPKFSPDGESVAFVGNYEGNPDLYVIPRRGGAAHRVTYHPGAETLCDWTHDDRLLYFTDSRASTRRLTELFTVSPEGGASTRLPIPYGANGSLGRDGKWLAYTPVYRDTRTWKRYMGGMAADIWLFNLEDMSSEQITHWEGTDSLPMWHRRSLYYVSDAGSEHRLNLWRYNTRTGERSQITDFQDYDVKSPSMGPGPHGGGEIVFQLGSHLLLIDLQSGGIREVQVSIPGDTAGVRDRIVDVSSSISAGSLSPEGTRAAVEARGDIWTAPFDKGIPRNLTRTSAVAERSPAWSPDGRWIAYFSDASGEYELYLTQSDGKGETKQLTQGSTAYLSSIVWSPDSRYILYNQNTGQLRMHDTDSGETKTLTTEHAPGMATQMRARWSHDSRWVTFAQTHSEGLQGAIFLHNVESGETHQVTSGMFADSNPVFDRKGDYLYFASSRSFSPTYSGLDTTFIYADTQRLLAVPLRSDVEDPWPLENDEVEWKEEEKAEEAKGEEEEKKDESEGEDSAAASDGVSGSWEGSLSGEGLPGGEMSLTLSLTLNADGTVTGTASHSMGTSTIEATYDAATGKIKGTMTGTDSGNVLDFEATIEGGAMNGKVVIAAAGRELSLVLSRVGDAEEGGDDAGKKDASETVEIELDGFEARAFLLPTASGNYNNLEVNDKNQLLYSFRSSQSPTPTVKMFDLKDKAKAEKEVAKGVFGFVMSPKGKKMMFSRGGKASMQNAGPGGAAKPLKSKGMKKLVNLREEWRQIFHEAWRLNRQFFYDPTMHGIDWPAVYHQYAPMVEDCTSRDDLEYVMGEMIGEINVGHAYMRGAPEMERGDNVGVGLLGVDFEDHEGAIRFKKIYRGAPWDSDAKSPFDHPGRKVEEGEYLLAVNGIPMSATIDPWSAFQGLVNELVVLTVSANPTEDDTAREVMVKTIGAGQDRNLRFRSWIEANRAYVEEKSGGQVGYVHVPDTTVNGQNNLFRQFVGNHLKKALIVDERFNSGGQIPTRFIELLSRFTTNYWAVRSTNDLPWPPFAHRGPKCMLINGWSGSGGDAFPSYFRQYGLGKLIGRRTWGGLVGISGGPNFVDGGQMAVPSFAFYENDGTWGIEGHGVEPDLDVVDDPTALAQGIDPQLDAAIELMLQDLKENSYQKPSRPDYPKRAGMGITEADK